MAVDMFLKLDGISGESQDATHKGEIEIQSFSFGATQVGNRGNGAGGGAGKVSFQDIHFTAPVNVSSPALLKACASGQHIKEATITHRKAGGTQHEFLKITLSDILVSSYSNGSRPLDSGEAGFSTLAEGDSDLPTDQITINFAKIQMVYTPQNADGSPGLTTGVEFADSTVLSAN